MIPCNTFSLKTFFSEAVGSNVMKTFSITVFYVWRPFLQAVGTNVMNNFPITFFYVWRPFLEAVDTNAMYIYNHSLSKNLFFFKPLVLNFVTLFILKHPLHHRTVSKQRIWFRFRSLSKILLSRESRVSNESGFDSRV